MANYSLKELRENAYTATKMKQGIHDASFVIKKIASIYEMLWATETPSYSDHNFAKVFDIFLTSCSSLEKDPYDLNSCDVFSDKITDVIMSPESGINNVTLKALNYILSNPVGMQDLKIYCENHSSSVSDQMTYCSEKFINHIQELYGTISDSLPITPA